MAASPTPDILPAGIISVGLLALNSSMLLPLEKEKVLPVKTGS